MINRSKSTLFLIEQLIVIAVFAICAAACISILTNAFFMARDSRDISNALLVGESVAESFKAASGDFDRAAQLSGASTVRIDGTEAIIMFFDSHWQVSTESEAEYVLHLKPDNHSTQNPNLLTTSLTVTRISGDNLITFPLAVRINN